MTLPVGTQPLGGPLVPTAGARLEASRELFEAGAFMLDAGHWWGVREDGGGGYEWYATLAAGITPDAVRQLIADALGPETAKRAAGDRPQSIRVADEAGLNAALTAQASSDQPLEIVFTDDVTVDGGTAQEESYARWDVVSVPPRSDAVERRFNAVPQSVIDAESHIRDGGDQIRTVPSVADALGLSSAIELHQRADTGSLFVITENFATAARSYLAGQRWYLARHHGGEAEMTLFTPSTILLAAKSFAEAAVAPAGVAAVADLDGLELTVTLGDIVDVPPGTDNLRFFLWDADLADKFATVGDQTFFLPNAVDTASLNTSALYGFHQEAWTPADAKRSFVTSIAGNEIDLLRLPAGTTHILGSVDCFDGNVPVGERTFFVLGVGSQFAAAAGGGAPPASETAAGIVRGATAAQTGAASGSAFLAWTRTQLGAIVNAIVPAVFRAGNTTRFPAAKMGSGAADATKVLHGDRTWKDLPSGLTVDDLPPFAVIKVVPEALSGHEVPENLYLELQGKLTSREIDGLTLSVGGRTYQPHASTPVSGFATEDRALVRFDISANHEEIGNNVNNALELELDFRFSFTAGNDYRRRINLPINNPSAPQVPTELRALPFAAARSINWRAASMFATTLTGDTTASFENVEAGRVLVWETVQDATGGRGITWPASVEWADKTKVGPSAAAGAKDRFIFLALTPARIQAVALLDVGAPA